MFEKKLSVLASRKRLLIAESEVNRILLVRDCEDLAGGMRKIAEPVQRLRAFAGSAGAIIAAFKAFRGLQARSEDAQHSGLSQGLLRFVLAIWTGLRSRNGVAKSHEPVAEKRF